MVARVEHGLGGGARAAEALAALADGAAAIGGASSLRDALGSVAETLVEATGAELAIVYVAERGEPSLVAVGVASVSAIVAAEVEGTRFPAAELRGEEVDELDALPATVARAARRLGTDSVLQLPVLAGGELVGCIDVLGADAPPGGVGRSIARLAA